MRQLLSHIDDPHLAFEALHVAGTNGKGSVVAFTDAMLGAGGVKRGRTTSPHLTSATERIVVEGQAVSRERFVALEDVVARAASEMEDPPTFFERIVAMAFRAFAEDGVQVAVVEVGLGGRLDATNTVRPRACAISRIGLDHTQFLGDTLAAIAREKAGILKPQVRAVSAPQEVEASHALRAVASEVGAPLRFVDEGDLGRLDGVPLGFGHGATTRENAAVACALLDEAGLVLDRAVRQRGLAAARWPGRFERVCEAPVVVVDGAHNAAAMRALADGMAGDPLLPRPLHVVVGMTRGHDARPFGEELRSLQPERVTVVRARAPRSRPAHEVAADLAAAGLSVEVAGGVGAGLEAALAGARESGGMVLVTGSLYLVGETRGQFLPVEEDPLLPEF